MKVPTERLREMLAACEGVTLGPWQTIRSLMPCDGEYDFAISASAAKVLSEAFGRAADGKVLPAEQNAAHIANCDPATIRSALSELLELREAVKAAPSPPIGDTGGVGEAPAAWQHRGPRGGWITTDEKMQWSERALYLRPVPARVEAVDHIADVGKKVDGWQPIETAPKDGTWFLGYRPVTSIEDTIDVWHWDPRAETDGAPGFWVNAADSNLDNFPTHWRPLPSPPALQANPS